MIGLVGGFHFGDAVDHIHAAADFAEHGIARALCAGVFAVEEIIVGYVDEKLAGGRIGVGGARHGDGADAVFQAVVGFVADGFIGGLLLHVGCETAALNHEAVNHTMEDGVVVEAFFGIVDEVGHGFGGFFSSSESSILPILVSITARVSAWACSAAKPIKPARRILDALCMVGFPNVVKGVIIGDFRVEICKWGVKRHQAV